MNWPGKTPILKVCPKVAIYLVHWPLAGAIRRMVYV